MTSFKQDRSRRFSNQFLLVVMAVVFLTFVALWIYQKTTDQPEQVVNQEQLLADDLLIANQAAWQEVELNLQEVPPIRSTDHLLGEIGAPVELIIYSDLTDPLAAGYLPIIHELKNQVGETVVIAWRQHPLADNQLASEAAVAAECAGQQDKFWEFADYLTTSAIQEKPLDDWLIIAQNIGLNSIDFENCLTKPEVQATIDKQSAEAQALGAIGVPSSFLNKTLLSGVYPLADFVSSDDQTKFGLLKLVQQAAGQTEEE